ncbi:SAM-dependent methyltransferase [Aeromonas hydrophila]|uniref:Class I SAM-dependent methyltransferase n=1 Tax=Aeromonas hydrophila TaxID=644 RepID=A0AAX3PCA2_AERHY|nr:class I SAM-dependent methyltransferase [Aeromonas hydrophila]WEE29112.1 class I SAM-dependent methyltransferase [Aeromonas hydrophila]HAT2491774.1 class I SAM-dependent methyltransferase [Aeromonas hydrophila]HAT2496555.1 class I SAM-dependent methyltransferase [Aeromonas hydrophila]HAT2511912.1 class I SAM-dependent methyltransferase [Aeromonas hydrophila]HAT2532404.1 class I SAM-dependent methyltransferase [Aeromonas hydrophila]
MPSADPWSAAHLSFLARLPPGAHLLEAGCGEGDDLCFFRQQGLVVTAFDARLAQARVASRRSGQPVRVCRIEQLHSVVPYDGIWARGALPAIAPDELSDALAHLAGLLKPAGPLYCAFSHPSGQPAFSDGTPEAAPPLAEDRLPRLDEDGLRQLIAPLPLQLQQCWESEQADGRWLHALLIRA